MRFVTFLSVVTAFVVGSTWLAHADGRLKPVKTRGPRVQQLANPRTIKLKSESDATVPFTVPFTLAPTREEFNRFVIVNANEDNKTWNFMGSGTTTCINYGYSYSSAADDWAFIPVEVEDENVLYSLSFEMKAQYSSDEECLEVGIGAGATPEDMTIVLDVDNFKHTSYKTYGQMFKPTGTGIQWIGFHANSGVYKSGISVRNISLEALTDPIPLKPAIEESSADGLDYTASVRIPSETLQGEPISGSVGLKVLVDDEVRQDSPRVWPEN